MHDSVAHPKPKSFLTCPDRLLGVPNFVKGKADGSPSDDARNCPHGEEGQEDVAEPLKSWEWEDTPKLEEEAGLEKHDGDVVAQRGDKDQLHLTLACRRPTWGPRPPQTLSKLDLSFTERVST